MVNIANTIDNIIVHLFCFPSLVLPLFFSKKLLVDEPVMVDDNPASSFDCISVPFIFFLPTVPLFLILCYCNINFSKMQMIFEIS